MPLGISVNRVFLIRSCTVTQVFCVVMLKGRSGFLHKVIVNKQIPVKNCSLKYAQFPRAHGLWAAHLIVEEGVPGRAFTRNILSGSVVNIRPGQCALACGALIRKSIDVVASCL